MGYGPVNVETLIGLSLSGDNGGILASVLLANLPQVIFLFFYLTYNGFFSCMLLMEEWNDFAHKCKSLCVTSLIGR